MAQFEIRRALPQDVQRITEIYNSNTEFLLHHLGRERVDRHFIAREMEKMRRVGFLSCVLVERESGRCVGVLDYRPGACVYLSLLMLDAALRGKGFGTACYGCLEEIVRRLQRGGGRHGQAARVRGRAACAFQCAPLSGCRGECLCTAYAAGGSSTLKKYVGNPKSEEDFLRIFLFLRICYFIQKIFYYDEKISEFR